MNQDKSLVPAYILEILRNHSSAEHPILHKEIVALLEAEYGIKMDRTAVSRNISTLAGAGLIETNGKGNGVYYDSREFDDSELRLLIHSVICNSAIPSRQAKDLVERLCAIGGRTSGLDQHYYIDPDGHYIDLVDRWQRSDNQELFRNIEIIDEAIRENIKIRFDYYGYGIDKNLHREITSEVSPYDIILFEQQYYLMAQGRNRRFMNRSISFFRIKHIRNIEKLDVERIPIDQLTGYDYKPDLGLVDADITYLRPREPEMITFRAPEVLLDDVIDLFGTDVIISRPSDNSLAVEVSVRSTRGKVERWALQNLFSVEIIAPETLRDSIRELIGWGIKKYGLKPEASK